MMHRLAALLICGISIAAAQTPLAPEVLLLSRIKRHMQQRLLQAPNYTCLETVERMQRMGRAAKFKTHDTVRLEVAEVDGRELFAWPGQKFDQANPGAFAHGGVMANGLFSMHARALFVGTQADFTYAGKEEVAGRELDRYDFYVPLLASGYKIRNPSHEATVAYHGSFWSDPESLDAYHFRVIAEEIPPRLGLSDAGVEIEYQKVRIGSSEALLPRRADLLLTEFTGIQRRNIISFSNCRQYGSESVLSFEPLPDVK